MTTDEYGGGSLLTIRLRPLGFLPRMVLFLPSQSLLSSLFRPYDVLAFSQDALHVCVLPLPAGIVLEISIRNGVVLRRQRLTGEIRSGEALFTRMQPRELAKQLARRHRLE